MIRRRGFTLVETLVALVVLSVGLLGSAALLLDSLRGHAGALRRIAALNLVRDMADRIRTNPRGAVYYDTSNAVPASESAASCGESSGCDALQLAIADRAHFESAAHALFPHGSNASVEFAPAIGATTPARFHITLRWPDPRDDAGTDSVALQVLVQAPVAG